MAMSRSAQGFSAALASAVFLSTTSIFIRHLVMNFDMPPLVLACWRNIIVVATLVPLMLLFDRGLLRVDKVHIPFLAIFGVMLAGFNGLWAISVAQNGAAVATVMVYCSVAYTAILGWKFMGESLGALKFTAIALCLGGCALISGALSASAWQSNLAGVIAGLLTGLCYTAYSLMGRMTSTRGISPWTTLLYIFAFAGVFLFLANLTGGWVPGSATTPGDMFWLGSSVEGWTVMILLGAIPTVGGYGFYNVSLSLLDASVANIIVSLEPLFTAVFAFFLLGETLTPVQLLGSALLLSGMAAIKLGDLRRPLPVPQEA
ncbi:drug/metabolite transporter (DMT)-like permease [Desulfomicrobium macestii]|uniref:Drug/metabolite transporter (DMT)-like permease n=1 Tax=Desulfomicrobium macestii TaxID=90731 RepID=A0ABR9H4B7_9BACT|nr:DMT family transporter [Desulfomicrobium macestii]MBE1425558.1 drug/metabolite transporter (DMT)-like permease [Desulfomicrobium macestii]